MNHKQAIIDHKEGIVREIVTMPSLLYTILGRSLQSIL